LNLVKGDRGRLTGLAASDPCRLARQVKKFGG
jgi:hypothetical protein